MGTSASNSFPVVGIGASAGGLAPLRQLLSSLPAQPGLAVVVVQHLDPHSESHLASLLQAHAALQVVTVADGTAVEANQAYVIQPNTNVALTDGVFSVTPRPDDRRPFYPIDHFFRSLALVHGPRAVGVVLSGSGSDGTLGLCEIKAAGGVTLAQDEETAQHPGMPASAIASGAVDLVLPPDQIAARIATLPQHPFLSGALAPEAAVDDGSDFQRVISALRARSGVDFSQYRDTTIKRRTARRMLLRGFQSPAEYAKFLQTDHTEVDALYRDVLINVTSFFRDPKMFDVLKERVIPSIVADRPSDQPIRVWVPGCSTGQEAYSLAMILVESSGQGRPIQVFATDLGDATSLERARAGVYPENIEAEISPERLRRFFTKENSQYRVQKSLRDLCVFARQNITMDPPFSRVDLVSCRNVMIYMSATLQERLLPVFHFALNAGGVLVLGMAETVGRFGDLFDVIDSAHKIYRRRESLRRPSLTFLANDWLAGRSGSTSAGTLAPPVDFQREADRLALGRYAPPSVLVDQNFEVQQFRGRTAPFLEPPAGQPSTSILRMAKDPLLMELRSALAEAKATKATVVREHLHVFEADRDVEFTLRILPVTVARSDDFRLLVLFETTQAPAWTGVEPSTEAGADGRDVAALRQELASTRQYLQSIVDDQEAATQELRAAHEEVLSSNEELQSTNEELETTKEELQSANEELQTVNEQFQVRNRELDVLTDDMTNFIASADLPMVTVGRDLCIRRLTPASERAFNLLPTDLGRSIAHIKFSIEVAQIEEVIETVIATVQPCEREVRDREGRWWLLAVRPYLTSDNRVDGATLMAVDIDLVRRSREVVEARDTALAIIRTVREPLVVLDAQCRIRLANDAFYRLVGAANGSLDDRAFWDSSRSGWSDPEMRRILAAACEGRDRIENLEVRATLPPLGERTLVLNAQGILRDGQPTLLLLAIEDVTDTRQAEALRIDAETLRLINRRKDEFLGILAHELRNPLAPMSFALELLRRADINPEDGARARQVLTRQVAHMVRIVDDLLDVSRITQGKVELRKERVELANVVHAAVELCAPAAEAARHTLTVSLPDEPIFLSGDFVRLSQVLVNLLNNAIKFTPPVGHIWLIAERTSAEDGHPSTVRIRVRDTGIGIAPEQRQRVFDLFMQGDRSLERSRGGLGVGLTLVRNLIALHGGSIDVWSDGPDRGSEFIITLPIEVEGAAPAVAPKRAADQTSRRSLRILVADDNEDGREMLAYLLTREGHVVALAADGREALDKAVEFDPDVAVLDIGMPSLNGYDVAARLRKGPKGSRPFLVALSGLGQTEEKARAAEAGFDYHFTKPVDLNALLRLLMERAPH